MNYVSVIVINKHYLIFLVTFPLFICYLLLHFSADFMKNWLFKIQENSISAHLRILSNLQHAIATLLLVQYAFSENCTQRVFKYGHKSEQSNNLPLFRPFYSHPTHTKKYPNFHRGCVICSILNTKVLDYIFLLTLNWNYINFVGRIC